MGQIGREGGKERGRGVEGAGGIRALCAEVLANMDWLPPSAAYLPSPSSPDPPTCRRQRQRIGGERIGGGGGGGGGLFAELASVFRPEAQVGPGGSMDSLGP